MILTVTSLFAMEEFSWTISDGVRVEMFVFSAGGHEQGGCEKWPDHYKGPSKICEKVGLCRRGCFVRSEVCHLSFFH